MDIHQSAVCLLRRCLLAASVFGLALGSVPAAATTSPAGSGTAPIVDLGAFEKQANSINSEDVDYCALQFPTSFTASGGTLSPLIYGRIYEDDNGILTSTPGAHPSILGQVGYGPLSSDPRDENPAWRWFPTTYNAQVGNDDEYQATFTVPFAPTNTQLSYTYRFSLDGGTTYTYCDSDGNGTNGGLSFSTANLGTMTINPGGQPTISINDVTLDEGNSGTTPFTFTISLNGPSLSAVTFDIATADNTATVADGDYLSNSAAGVVIPAGQTSTTFTVLVNGDTTFEPNESFFVNVINVVGAAVGDGQGTGTGTIINDDDPCATYIFPYTLTGNTPTELIQAIECANANGTADVIDLGGQTVTLTTSFANYSGATGLPQITTPVTVRNGTITRTGSNEFRFFSVSNTGSLTVRDLNLTNGGGATYAGNGGSIISSGTASTLVVVNTTVSGSQIGGLYNGSGIFSNASFTIVNSSVIGGGTGRGAIASGNGPVLIQNTLIAGNSGPDTINGAGGVYFTNLPSATIVNSTIVGNYTNTTLVTQPGGIFASGGTINLTIRNSIIWGNSNIGNTAPQVVNTTAGTNTVTNSLIQGGQFGALDSDPLFVTPITASATPSTAGNFQLADLSPAIDAGANADVPSDTFDVNGNSSTSDEAPDRAGAPRRYDDTGVIDTGSGTAPIVDIGAYERQTSSILPIATVTPTSLSVSEEGATTDTFVVSLNLTPATNVTTQLTFDGNVQVDSGSGFGPSPQTVTLTPANAITGVTVTVRAVDDAIDEASPHFSTVTTSVTSSATPAFNGLAVDDVIVAIIDNDTAGITVTESGGGTSVTEGGASDSYTVVLNSQPIANVGINIVFDASQLVLNGDTDGSLSLQFTPADWNVPQTVTVVAVDDTLVEANPHSSVIVQTVSSSDPAYAVINPADVTVSIAENDFQQISFVAASSSVSETAGAHTVTVRLSLVTNGAPGGVISSNMTANVVLALGTAEAADLALVTTSVTFPAGSPHNSSLPIDLTVFNDRLLEGNETVNLSLALVTSTGSVSGTHEITVIDDEVGTISFTAPGSATSESVGTHSGAIGSLTISGSGTGPLASEASVSVAITDAAGTATTPADYTLSTSALVFPANAPSPVELPIAVSIVNDVLIENIESFSLGFGAISGAGVLSASGTHVVSIVDNDLAEVGFAAGDDSVGEGDGSFSKPVLLTLTADGVGTPSLQDALLIPVGFVEGTALEPEDFTLATASVSFPAGSLDGAAQNASVNLVDDAISEAAETFDMTLGDGFVTSNIALGRAVTTVTIIDNDVPGVAITQSGGGNAVSEDGDTDTYSIVLESEPIATVNVVISFPASQVTLNGDTDGTFNTTFTALNWNIAQTITIAAVNDRALEGDHSASLEHAFVSSDANYNGITAIVDGGASSNTLNVAITDNETAELRWSPSSASAAEGSNASGAVVLDITANPPGGTPTLVGTISYTLTPIFDTAVAADLGTITGSLSFTNVSDLASNAITIPHLTDTLVEGEEQYSLAITLVEAPAGTSVASAPFVGTIVDTNSATVSLSGSATVSESVGSSELTVSLNTGGGDTLANPVSVAIDLSDGTATYGGGAGDYFFAGPSTTATVTFPAGSGNAATQSVAVSIRDDALVENSESFSASLGSVTGTASASGGPVVITIDDNDSAVVGFESPSSSASEGSTPHSVNAQLTITAVGSGTPALAVPISAMVTQTPGTADATDYTLSTTSVSFAAATPSAATQPIAIDIIDDLIAEGDETFSLGFGAVTGPATASGSHTVTVVDNDTAGVLITQGGGSTGVTEGGTNDTYTLQLTSQPVDNVTIAINADSQLVAGPTSLTFTSSTWNVAQEVTVTAVDDTVVEGLHIGTLSHVVSSGDSIYNGISIPSVDVEITDNDSAVVSFSPISVSQSESSSPMSFTVTLSNPVQSGVTLSVNSAFGTATEADFSPVVGGTVSFAPNSTASQTVSVAITNDVLDENDESFTLTLSNLVATGDVSLGDAIATGTIIDDDPSPTISVSSPSQPEGDSGTTPLNFVVSLSTVSGRDVTFTRATQDGTATVADGDYVPLAAAQALIPAGELSVSIPVLISGDTTFEGDETFFLNITDVINATPGSLSGVGTIEDDDQQPTTTTILSSLPDPSLVGQPYTVSVRVSAQSLSPLGTVMVSDGTNSCGPINLSPGVIPDSGGSCELTSGSAGAKLLTASYTPEGTAFAASSGTQGHQVDPASTLISVSGPANSRVNQPVSFAFTLDVDAPGGGTPSGTVTLSTAGSSCQVTVPSATPACALQFGALGPATVSASYAPDDGDHLASTSSGAGNAQTLVFALAELQVTKTVAGDAYLDGDLLVYTVTLRNLGEDTAVDLLLTDEVPTGLVDVLWTCDSSGGLVCPQSNGSGGLDEAIPRFPVGGLLNYSFFGNVDGYPAQIVNTASVSLPVDGRVQDPNPVNNSATVVSLSQLIFEGGFEAMLVSGPDGNYMLPAAGLQTLLDDVGRILFVLDDVNGHAARVYARMHAGHVQYALAQLDGSGRLRLHAWQSINGDPQLSWSARESARGWVVESVELR